MAEGEVDDETYSGGKKCCPDVALTSTADTRNFAIPDHEANIEAFLQLKIENLFNNDPHGNNPAMKGWTVDTHTDVTIPDITYPVTTPIQVTASAHVSNCSIHSQDLGVNGGAAAVQSQPIAITVKLTKPKATGGVWTTTATVTSLTKKINIFGTHSLIEETGARITTFSNGDGPDDGCFTIPEFTGRDCDVTATVTEGVTSRMEVEMSQLGFSFKDISDPAVTKPTITIPKSDYVQDSDIVKDISKDVSGSVNCSR